MNRELIALRSNTIVMESLHDIALDLPAKERMKYTDIVTEAMINNPDTQMRIITKLSKQVEGLQEIDLDQCKKSMGNITKYPYYDAMNRAMEIINDSEVTGDIPNVIRMNKIHNILLDNADDFIWGYKHNDMIIKKMYILMTRLLFIMIDLSISDYVKKLEVSFKFNAKFDRTSTKVSKVIVDADRMIKLFENGNWRQVVNAAKKSATNRNMKAIDEMEGVEPKTATEGILPFVSKNNGTTTVSVPKTLGDTSKGLTSWWDALSGGARNTVIIGSIVIAILMSYRTVAFYIARMGAKFANCIRHCAELIKANDTANRSQGDSAVEKHSKVYNLMVGIADRIDAFFDKASREAAKDESEANRKDFNTNEITQIDTIDFGV